MLWRGVLVLFISLSAWAQSDSDKMPMQISGSARFRSEWKNNADFSDQTGDSVQFSGTRFFLEAKFTPNDRTFMLFQPQFSKTWGQDEYVPTGAPSNSATGTSGGTKDTRIDAHQVYVRYQILEAAGLTIGRKELNFGDQLLVGPLGWSNIGRAFDLVAVHSGYGIGSVEIFTAKIKDENANTAGVGDRDFSGVYSANSFGEWLKEADVYYFLSDDATVATVARTHAYGVRLKSPVGRFDYRIEGTFESVVNSTTNSDEHQYDVEAGFQLVDQVRLSAEYFHASAHFDSLYPTGHKWLGYADLFSRRNVEGYRVGLNSRFGEKWSATLDYHEFFRAESNTSAYKLSGAPYGSIGRARDMAAEVDLVVSYKFDQQTAFEAGAARAEPRDYLRANGMPDGATFYYLQAATKF